eukprot:157468-Pleurochrysis_carterae.AAC.1
MLKRATCVESLSQTLARCMPLPSAAKTTAQNLRTRSAHVRSRMKSGVTNGHRADGARARTGTKT